ncbi:MAG: FecR domain-containing protein [Gammaproteobacteria bacterium]
MRLNRLLAILLVSLFSILVSGQAVAQAALAERIKGQVSAATAAGEIRELEQGSEIFSGETVATGPNSMIQMNFTDGSIITLRPNSRFQIQDYAHDPDDASKDSGFFSMLKGGLRAVTGLVGQRSRRSYRVETAVATIGIRGTDFELRLCAADCQDVEPLPQDGLYAGVNDDGSDSGIIIINETGEYELNAGQYALILGKDVSALPLALRPRALGTQPLVCE